MSFSANSTISSWRIVMSTSPEIFLSKSFSPPETCQLAQFARGQPSLKFPGAMSKCMSNEHEQANLYSIFFTCISPPRMSSSRMKYAFSKLKIMSSSHTDPKYLSSTSTYLKTVLEVLERTILHWAALMVLAQWPPRKHNQWKENLWITSSTLSSLSVRSTAKQKKRLA